MDMPIVRGNAPTVPELWSILEKEKRLLEATKRRVADAEKSLEAHVIEALKGARLLLAKDEGVVHVELDGVDVESNIPKTIKWDQDKLNAAAVLIEKAGHDPADWIDVELSIAEGKWKAMPAALQQLCSAARTVKHGKQAIKVNTEK